MGSIASVLSTQASAAAAINPTTVNPATINPLTVDVGFTTKVGGQTYDGGVIYSGGQYVAEDGNVSGAVATGTSVQAAEDNLITRIDVLV